MLNKENHYWKRLLLKENEVNYHLSMDYDFFLMYLIQAASLCTKSKTCKDEDVGNKLDYQGKRASYCNMDLLSGKKRGK